MKKFEVHQLRVEGTEHFGGSIPIAVCDNKENAQRIVDSLNKNEDERILFAFGVREVKYNNYIRCYNCKKSIEYNNEDIINDIYVCCPDCGEIICLLD